MSDFIREDRFYVLKHKDIKKYLTSDEIYLMECMFRKVKISKWKDTGDEWNNCVVVEEDWPEYETVWKMIEERVNNE